MVQVTPTIVRLFVLVVGNTMNAHITFLDGLLSSPNFQKVKSEDKSDVTIAFVAVVSRAGTDIEAALKKIPETQRSVLVVLHHTYDPEFIAPDSRHAVNRSNVFTVDCLFHEDQGLLKCQRNSNALKAVKQHLGAAECTSCSPGETNKVLQWCRQYKWVLLGISLVIILLIVLGCLFA
ncbi:hypothetical protein AOLI_G00283340 [Acnodon oligacanthus]